MPCSTDFLFSESYFLLLDVIKDTHTILSSFCLRNGYNINDFHCQTHFSSEWGKITHVKIWFWNTSVVFQPSQYFVSLRKEKEQFKHILLVNTFLLREDYDSGNMTLHWPKWHGGNQTYCNYSEILLQYTTKIK